MKRKINIFFHNIREIKRNKFLRYKIRLLLFLCVIVGILTCGLYSLIRSYSLYESKAKMSLDIQTAMYVIEEGTMSFNIDLKDIIPSTEPYKYTFSISNFNDKQRTDVDLEYVLSLQTTTNLPLNYHLYDEADPNTDIIGNTEIKQDEDNAWYKTMEVNDKYSFGYEANETHMFTLVVEFPEVYKSELEYSKNIDNIQIIVDSKQIIEE